LGLTTIVSDGASDNTLWVLVIGGIAMILLFSGSYKWIERTMIVLVLLMSIVFIVTAVVVAPPIGELLAGFVPSLPDQSTLLVIGLIGTTVVPYNLFLHSSSVTERWKNAEDLPEAQLDTWASITIGGLISIAIVITSAMAALNTSEQIGSATDLARQLEPLLGSWSKYFMGAGLFAAGISSSITAPLAAGYATSGILGIKSHPSDTKFKIISIAVLIVGIIVSLTGFNPIEVIRFAQIANGLLLPVTAFFLIWIMNKYELLGEYKNSRIQNILGITIVIITVVLGLKSILSVTGIL
jgi:Mn2+/Fe2+ NRAMP family transporter